MLSKLQIKFSGGWIVGCVIGILVACLAAPALVAAPASIVLLDFKDDARFGQIRLTGHTTIEPAQESYQGKRAAKIVFAAVPDGVRDYPAMIIEGP